MSNFSNDDIFSLEIKFKGNSLNLSNLRRTDTIGHLKSLIYDQTAVSPENQKLLGFKAAEGLQLADSLTFRDVLIPSNSKIILMGSTQDQIKAINTKKKILNKVVNDLDCKEIDKVELSTRPEYVAKVDKRIKEYKVTVVEQPRLETKLLVLDIDYTIFDHRSTAQSVRDLMRPFLHDFLRKVYPTYDIAIWSATGMGWIRTKLREMGLISRPLSQSQSRLSQSAESDNTAVVVVDQTDGLHCEDSFKISLILDQAAMISVHFPDEGVKEVKPLRVIWENYPQWGPHNTVMFDDIKRNFAMNPQSGLKIKPYRHSARTRDTDKELLDLADYLIKISLKDDFTKLNHKNWRYYMEKSNNSSKKAKIEK